MRRLLVAAVLSAATIAWGQGSMTDNFDASPGTGYKLGADAGPGPVVVGGDPYAGNFLRLVTDGVASQNNHWTYPSFVGGAYDNITAEFDFRGMDAMTNQSADGFHFLLVPTSMYGAAGDGPNATAEEPNSTNVFAVGFDFHPADGATPVNDVSAHWDASEQVNHRAPTNAIKLDNQQFHHAKVELSRVGNSSIAKVTLTPNVSSTPGTPWVAFEQIMPRMAPYENRVQFGARTGGRDMSVDIDNVSVTWNLPGDSVLPTVATNRLLQDFDRLGTTRAAAAQHSGSIVGVYRPGVLPMDSGTSRGVFARLVHDGVNTCVNSLSFNMAGPSLAAAQVTSFDFRLQSGGNSADGLGLLFLPTRTYGQAGAGPGLAAFEEPNLANTLAVGLDLYNAVNDASVHFNGAERTNVTVDAGLIDLNDGRWHRATITNRVVPGGMNVSVALTPDIDGVPGAPVPAIVDQFLPGLNPYEWRVQLGARTGGSYVNADVDNIMAEQGPKDLSRGYTHQDFDAGHTYYEVWKQPTSNPWPPELLTNGPSGNCLRLVSTNQTNCRNSIAFDRAADGGLPGTGKVTIVDFDFRVSEYNANGNPADGFGLLLIPTATYGETGEGAFYRYAYNDPEEPNLAGALAVGFDLYPASSGVNDVSVHWNGAELQNVTLDPATQVDLSSGAFHHAKLLVRWGESDSYVTLVVNSNSLVQPGPAIIPVDNLGVGGLAGYEYRVEIAARTGGQTCAIDLDNVDVRTVSAHSYTAWIAGFHDVLPARRDPLADPDGDGQPNLVEYFAAASPVAAQGNLISAAVSVGSSLGFEFRRSTDIPDVIYVYEWSRDLQEWFPPDATHTFSEQVTPGDGTYDIVRATLNATPGEPHVFARIRIVLP